MILEFSEKEDPDHIIKLTARVSDAFAAKNDLAIAHIAAQRGWEIYPRPDYDNEKVDLTTEDLGALANLLDYD